MRRTLRADWIFFAWLLDLARISGTLNTEVAVLKDVDEP